MSERGSDEEWESSREDEEYELYPTYASYGGQFSQFDRSETVPALSRLRLPESWRWGCVAAAALLVLAALAAGLVVYTQVSSFHCLASSSKPVALNVYYDTQMQGWLNKVVGDFKKQCPGAASITLHGVDTAQSMQNILSGRIQPDVWIPASTAWLGLLNANWQKNHYGSSLVSAGGAATSRSFNAVNAVMANLYGNNTASDQATSSPSLLKSPVVIAMWEPMARVLGWPNKPIYWANIAALSTDPNGWATYGHREWGHFKFAHTNPDTSDTGLEAILAENYAAVQKVSGLTVNDVNGQKAQRFVTAIESSVIHYGNSVDALADEMFTRGPSYLSAVVMNESMLAQANKKYSHLKYPVVAIYPQDGTMVSDYPFAIPQGSWVTSAQRSAATSLSQFMLQSGEQQKAFDYYLRPGNSDVSALPNSPLSKAYGIDLLQPGKASQANPPVDPPLPSPCQERNVLNVTLILDHSASMQDSYDGASKLDKARQGLINFASKLCDRDGLGLTIFSDSEQVLTPIGPLGPKRSRISGLVNGIRAGGYTRLYDTIADQYAALQALPAGSIKALIVLTDGINDTGSLTLNQLINKITPGGSDQGEAVRVYTIAYGNPNDINLPALQQIARATGGKEYPGTPQSIDQVYTQILQQNV